MTLLYLAGQTDADGSSSTDRYALWISLAAFLVSALAVFVTWKLGQRNIGIATEAKNAAATMAATDLDRDHEAKRPERNGEFVNRGGNLFFKFDLPRDYAIRAEVRGDRVNHPQVSLETDSGTHVIQILSWSEHPRSRPWDELVLWFWPPAVSTDDPDPWMCRCGKPVEVNDAQAHWRWRSFRVPQDRGEARDQQI